MRLAIFAAFPQEIEKIITRLKAKKDEKKHRFDVYHATRPSTEIILVITGIGTANAESAVRYIHTEFDPDLILSIGYGGALYEGADIGSLIWGSTFILMPNSLEEKTCPAPQSQLLKIPADESFRRLLNMVDISEGSIVTLPTLIKKSELKKAISQEIPNPVCDMETYPIAFLCLQIGLRFAAVRSITDLQNEDIPIELCGISDSSGKYSIFCALRTFMSKPQLLKNVFRLARNSHRASQNLCSFVLSLLETLQ